jgi:hypothetical protein
MNFGVFIFVLTSLKVMAGPFPAMPKGWVELKSSDPVILSWARALPEKNLEEVPTLMVQRFPRTEKFVQFIQTKKNEKDCRELELRPWNQTWCLKKDSVLVVLSKNEDQALLLEKKKLLDWVRSQ